MPAITDSKYLVRAGWSDVPHLDERTKMDLRSSTPPHLIDAREHGKPSLGAGAIYPIPTEEILCDPFQIPPFWPRGFGMDVGWKRTAAVWGAWDRSVDVIYLYTEHYRGKAEPSIHATAIRARGEWIPGMIDPAARGRSQKDGEQLFWSYQQLGLALVMATNAVESGIYAVWERLSTGRLKIFRTLQNWQAEYMLYRRDEDGKIIKEFDHLMDCTRYLVLGKDHMKVQPVDKSRTAHTIGGDRIAGY